MKQHESVIKTMEEYGGYATLGFLNQTVDVSNWKTMAKPLRETFDHNDYLFNLAVLEKGVLESII